MKLPIFNQLGRQEQTRWASEIETPLSNQLLQGILLTDIPLVVGPNTINHRLARKPIGYLVTGMRDAASAIYNTPSPMPDLTLVLQSSAVCTIDLYVF